MADDQNTGSGSGSQTPDPIANIKGEFNRKIGNLEQQMTAMAETNKALVSQLKTLSKPAASEPAPVDEDGEIERQWFDNPQKAASLLASKVKKEVTQEVAAATEYNNRRTGTIAELVQDFPELQQTDHKFTKRAVEIFNSMSVEDQKSPIAYKAAVSQAALEQGVAPKSKREQSEESDDFTLDGSGSSGIRQERSRSKSGGIDKATVDFARLMGVNIDDEKVKQRIKNQHGRRTYNRYE